MASLSTRERRVADCLSDAQIPSPPDKGIVVLDVAKLEDWFAVVLPGERPSPLSAEKVESLNAMVVISAGDDAAVPRAIRKIMRFGAMAWMGEVRTRYRVELGGREVLTVSEPMRAVTANCAGSILTTRGM